MSHSIARKVVFFFLIVAALVVPGRLIASNNPVPFLNPIVPSATAPGGPAFTLTVTGTDFVSGSTVDWNGGSLTTTFVSAYKLTAAVPAAKRR